MRKNNTTLIEWEPIEIWSAQMDWKKMRIYMERQGIKHYISWVFWEEDVPLFPRDSSKSNFIYFTKKGWDIDIVGMKVQDEFKWKGVIDVLFNTIWRVSDLTDIGKIGAKKTRKPSIAKKLQKLWFTPNSRSPILWEVNWYSDEWIPQISIYKPDEKNNVTMKNSSQCWDYQFYDIVKHLDSPPVSGTFPLQECTTLDTMPDSAKLLENVDWKYRLSESKIKQFI